MGSMMSLTETRRTRRRPSPKAKAFGMSISVDLRLDFQRSDRNCMGWRIVMVLPASPGLRLGDGPGSVAEARIGLRQVVKRTSESRILLLFKLGRQGRGPTSVRTTRRDHAARINQ